MIKRDTNGIKIGTMSYFHILLWCVCFWFAICYAFKKKTQQYLTFIVQIIAFGIVIALNSIAQYDMSPLYWYIICVFIQIIAFYLSQNKPAKTLLIFSLVGVIAMILGIFTKGTVATYAFLTAAALASLVNFTGTLNLSCTTLANGV